MKPYDELLYSCCEEAILLVDPKSLQIVAHTPACRELLGHAELTGRPITDLECALSDIFYWEEVRHGQVQGRDPCEGLYLDAQGNTLSVQKRVVALAFAGEDLLAIHLRTDEYEKQASLELEKSAALLQATLESTADGILVLDLNGSIVHFNRRFADFWQLSERHLQGRESGIYRQMMRRFRQKKAARQFMTMAREARDQESFILLELKPRQWLECRIRPHLLADSLLGHVFTFTDITARILAEEQLQTAITQAQAANQAKTDFLNHMSHELRTPLNAILGFAQILQSEGCAPQDQRLDLIIQGGWHLLGLINEVLDLASVEAGKLTLAREFIDPRPLFEECLAFVRVMAEQRQVSLHPATSSTVPIIFADPRRLRQVLLNLLSNAIKYNHRGGNVWLNWHTDTQNIFIAIRDDGPGIQAQDQERIFETFNRVGNRQHKVEGTGIGLNFSRSLARLMDGDILLTSTPGQGSTFSLQLPLAARAPCHDARPLQILYVDDDASNRLIMQGMVRKMAAGHQLHLADSGQQALTILAQTHIDLLMTDLNLEDMSGLALIAQIDAAQRPACFMISASDNDHLRQQALDAGFLHYLSKPLRLETLSTAIAQIACG